jgi:hypothetical protein
MKLTKSAPGPSEGAALRDRPALVWALSAGAPCEDFRRVFSGALCSMEDDRRLFGRLTLAAQVILVAQLVNEFVYFLCCDPNDRLPRIARRRDLVRATSIQSRREPQIVLGSPWCRTSLADISSLAEPHRSRGSVSLRSRAPRCRSRTRRRRACEAFASWAGPG